jgi:hypothetical protein
MRDAPWPRRVPLRAAAATAFAVAAVACGALATSAVAQTGSRSFLGTFGTNSATGLGGQFTAPQGIAVNRTGAGGVTAGTEYVLANNRITQFGPTGSFVRTWGVDVIASGGNGDIGTTQFEICSIAAECKNGVASSTAGGLNGPQGIAVDQASGKIYVNGQGSRRVDAFSATGAFDGAFGWGVIDGQPALQFCTTVCQSGIAGAGAGQFAATQAGVAVDPTTGHVFVNNGTNNRVDEFAPVFTGGVVTGATFVKAFGWDVAPGSVDEQQEVRVRATGGTFKLAFGGQATVDLAASATAAEVEAALNALGSINSGGGSVAVIGGPGNTGGAAPYVVSFNGGPLAATDVSELVGTNGSPGLTGGTPTATVSVRTRANGGATGTGLEACTAASACKTGVAGNGTGQFGGTLSTLPSIAVDSGGTIYVLSLRVLTCTAGVPCRVQRFNTDGTGGSEFASAELTNIASNSNRATRLTTVGTHLLAAYLTNDAAFVVKELDSSGALLEESPSSEGHPTAGAPTGIAADAADRLYLTSGDAGAPINVFGPVPAPTATVAAVSDVGSSTVTFNGSVEIPAPGFPTAYRFEYSTNGVTWTRADADLPIGAGAPGIYPVASSAAGLQPNTAYLVRLVATTVPSHTSSTAAFTTDPAGPELGALVADADNERATITGWVDPNGQTTTYRIEWGPTTALDNTIPQGGRAVGAGNDPLYIHEELAGLVPNTTYYYRLVATNTTDQAASGIRTFTTDLVAGRPNGRVSEMVFPADDGA